jgi:hypothetical protein
MIGVGMLVQSMLMSAGANGGINGLPMNCSPVENEKAGLANGIGKANGFLTSGCLVSSALVFSSASLGSSFFRITRSKILSAD